MAGAATAGGTAEGVRVSQHSAFSAVVRKNFSSFSVDSILAPDSHKSQKLNPEDLRVASSGPCDPESDHDEVEDVCGTPSPSGRLEDDVHGDTDEEEDLRDDDDDEGSTIHLPSEEEVHHTGLSRTAASLLNPPRRDGTPFSPPGGGGGLPHHPVLPPSLQPGGLGGLWPPLHLIQHHLALRAFASRYIMTLVP